MTDASNPPAKVAPHGLRPMSGRDPRQHERASTPLELLYDLTIVVAFSISGAQFAHSIAGGHLGAGLAAFVFCGFATVWAWIGFTWFASAYDTDDWLMRLLTLVQMVGVVVLSLGIADVYHGFEEGHLDNKILVAGYVIMRVSMIALWLRAARSDPARRGSLMILVRWVGLAQIGWVIAAFAHLPGPVLWLLLVALYALELGAYLVAERRGGLPWNAGHIAERYGLLFIISLGEIVLGTTEAVEALVEHAGWSTQAVLIAAAGVCLAFGLWWAYFALPWPESLQRQPGRSFGFGYGHLPLYLGIAAIGAGLHVAAYFVAQETTLVEGQVMLAMAIPVFVVVGVFFALARWMFPGRDRFHGILLVASLLTIVASVVLAYLSVPLGVCIVVLMITPWISVVGYETRGHAHIDEVMQDLRQEPAGS